MNSIECKKSDLVQQLLWLDNKPYSLEGREPMRTLYDVEENAKILMCGRQYGKSTFIASDLLLDSLIRPFFKTLYVTPRQEQTSEFSNSKLQPFIRHSPVFRELMIDDESVNNVWKKNFRNGSEVTLKYAYLSADASRGVSSDHLLIDEIQDIIHSNISVLEECLAGSKYQWRTFTGTPKSINNTLAIRWAQSTQNEYVLKCSGCNKWNIIGIENIGPSFLMCKKCGKELKRDGVGQWVAKKKLGDPQIYLSGYRVPQVLSPVAKWSRIIEKLNTYSNTRFMNEVLALPADSSATPLVEDDLKKICVLGKNEFKRTPNTEGIHLFMGADFGMGQESLSAKRGGSATGYTVICIGGYDWDNKFQLLALKRFVANESDPIFQVDEITRIARALNITVVGCDFGGAWMQNAQLKQRLGVDRIIEWQASDGLKVQAKWCPEAGRMIFNRTEAMTNGFVDIKNQNVKFFNWAEFSSFAPDFLTVTMEYRSDGRSMYYSHSLPDDAVHAFLYCKMTTDHILKSGQ